MSEAANSSALCINSLTYVLRVCRKLKSDAVGIADGPCSRSICLASMD